MKGLIISVLFAVISGFFFLIGQGIELHKAVGTTNAELVKLRMAQPVRYPIVEHKAVRFCREEYASYGLTLDKLSKEGFRYIGTISQDGINCTWVAFGKDEGQK